MTDEIVIVPEQVMLGSIPTKPQEVIRRASEIATELAGIVEQRGLYKNISGKKYVLVEGWNTLGAMLGILPVEQYCKKIENGYEAAVDLIRTSDGTKVGGSSSICTRDESLWATRDEYAIRSMSITRATGKAFRLGFSWIMKLAGYEPTPAEEMPHEDIIDAVPSSTGSVTVGKPPDYGSVRVPFKKAKELFGGNPPTMKELAAKDYEYVVWMSSLDNDIGKAAKGYLEDNNLKPAHMQNPNDVSALLNVKILDGTPITELDFMEFAASAGYEKAYAMEVLKECANSTEAFESLYQDWRRRTDA